MEFDLLGILNDEQREAVLHTDGPLLVLAGAGSGKTRVIAHRVARLLAAERAGPEEIVAVTFTNKAANEMRERIATLLGGLDDRLDIRTFHSLCLRILRREAAALGYPNQFLVYDALDQLSVVRDCLRSHPEAKETWSARQVRARISSAKNLGVDPESFEKVNRGPNGPLLASLYAEYERRLRRAKAMDFDDLLLNALRLFQERPEIGGRYAERCRYLLVDEYQDTNRPQHELVKCLSGKWGNVCVVGDEDQSIYGFRGALVGNILRFEDDFPGTRTIKLERNYRSTKRILAAASAVVARNRGRIGKTLWTDGDEGDRLVRFRAPSDREEAFWAVGRIREWTRREPQGSFAVLYRTNSQSRPLEEALNREGIPYRMVGGLRFYERKEIKDLLAYLRLLLDPDDDVSFDRILNVPPRSIGPAARMGLEGVRQREACPLQTALERCLREKELPARSLKALGAFHDLLASIRSGFRPERPAETLGSILERIDYVGYLRSNYPEAEADDRARNVDELLTALSEFEGVENGLAAFLDQTSLMGETDSTSGAGRVVLMTIHAAKGLEFPAVLLAGLEEGLLPHARSFESEDDIEEERRLFYVGLTRAERQVFLTHAVTRRTRGTPEFQRPSRFLDEIPPELVEDRSEPEPAAAGAWTAEEDESQETDGAPFRLGQRVHHPTLGVATVIGIEGSGENLKLTLSFVGGPARKILPRYTHLRPVAP